MTSKAKPAASRKRSRLRNWGFWIEYKRPGYLGVKVEKVASSALLDEPGGYRKELNKLVRSFRKKHGKIVVTDVMFGGKPSWGQRALAKKSATPRRRTTKNRRRTSRR